MWQLVSAGVFSLEDALALVATRARLMQKLPGGAMLSIALPEQAIQSYLGDGLSLAAVNDPASCVVAGPDAAISALEAELTKQDVAVRRLVTSHAFHSEMMTPILGPLGELFKRVHLSPPTIPYVSNVTGTWITAQEATDPGYWIRHLRDTVRFADGLRTFAQGPEWVFIEIGPGNSLSTFARRRQADAQLVLSSLRHPREQGSDVAFLQGALGRLWLAGLTIAWHKVNANARHQRVPLPTYPFERQRYWIERQKPTVDVAAATNAHTADAEFASALPAAESNNTGVPSSATTTATTASTLHPRPAVANAYAPPDNELEATIARVWQVRLGIGQIGVHDNFFELGGDSLLATQIVAQLSDTFKIALPLQHFFQHQTIAGLAEIIESLLLEEIAALTEDEAEGLLP